MSAVTVTEAGASASVILVGYSALRHCVTRDGDTVTPNWPRLSSGETLLWQVLEAVNGQGGAPSDADLEAGLDELNLHYAQCALREQVAS